MGRFSWSNWSLATKLTLTTTGLLIFAVVGVTMLSLRREQQTFRRELKQQAETLLSALAAASSDALYNQDIDFLEDITEKLGEEEVLVAGRIYSQDGRIVADAYYNPGKHRQIFSLEPDAFGTELIQSDSTVFNWLPDRLRAGKKITAGRQILGAISVGLSTEPLEKKMSATRDQGLMVALAAAAVGTFVALFLSRSITEPLQEMTTASQRMADGELTQRIAIRSNDELALLAKAFNTMTTRLRELINDLEEQTNVVKEKVRQEALVNKLAHQIRESLELDTILETAVQQIYIFLQLDICQFFWVEKTPIPVWHCVKEAKLPELPTTLGKYPIGLNNPFNQKILHAQLIKIDDIPASSATVAQLLNTFGDLTALLVVPLTTPSGKIGFVCCAQKDQPRQWKNKDVQLLQAVCDQLAIAISQAELYHQATSSAELASHRATELEHTLAELKHTQAQLIQQEKMAGLGQLVAGVAHEINNPVSFIQGNVTPAQEYTADLLSLLRLYQNHYPHPDPEIHQVAQDIDLEFLMEDFPKLLDSMEVGAVRIAEIVQSLRNFSRLDEAEMKRVNIHDGINSTLMILRNRLKAQSNQPKIEIIKQYGELPPVICYPGQLNQVFMNILTNSIDALELLVNEQIDHHQAPAVLSVHTSRAEGCMNPSFQPKIWIRTQMRDARTVVVSIKDNGMGIPKHIQPRLFDPFFTTKPVGKGTGLGLSISYQIIVERHGGELSCKSFPGEGSEFIIEIPIHP